MYGNKLDELQTMMNNMMKSERKLDQKCSDLSNLCRTLLSGMRDAIKHDTMDYDQRKQKSQVMSDLFDELSHELVDKKMNGKIDLD
tara:strand:- start:705 stop:962 length:258 start_codon:yes stop_codon:yes gene_type:complete